MVTWGDWPWSEGGASFGHMAIPRDERPLDAVTDDEWQKALDAQRQYWVVKELRRVADLLMVEFRPRPPGSGFSPKTWQRLEAFLERQK